MLGVELWSSSHFLGASRENAANVANCARLAGPRSDWERGLIVRQDPPKTDQLRF
jgi:hypothetical protein